MTGLRVFLSHASADLDTAVRVHGWLTAAGHEVFLDRHPSDGIAVGDAWEERLHERLRRADAVVCVVTTAYRRRRGARPRSRSRARGAAG